MANENPPAPDAQALTDANTVAVASRFGSLTKAVLIAGFCGVIVHQVLQQRAPEYLLILVLLMARPFIVFLRLSFAPPRMSVVKGQFNVRVTGPGLTCAAGMLEEVFLEGKNLALRLSPDLLERLAPAAREAFERQHERMGSHLTIRGGFFSQAQVDAIRRALGKEPQSAVGELSPLDGFHRSVRFTTPYAFVTPLLVVANVGVFAAMLFAGVDLLMPTVEDVAEWGGNVAALTLGGESWRLITAAFLHIGIVHLAINMWVLTEFGVFVERLMGNLGFLTLYALSAFGGSFASVLLNSSDKISAGASGAIFGVIGGLLGFFVIWRSAVPAAALKELRNSAVGFVLFNVLFGLTMPMIDNAGHLGGLATGFVCGLALSLGSDWRAKKGRNLRAVVLAVAGAGAVYAGIQSLPEGPLANPLEFARLETEAIDCYNQARQERQARRIDDLAFADELDRECLPRLRRAREIFAQLSADSADDADPKRRRYFRAQERRLTVLEQAWVLIIESVREKDTEKARRADELLSEANRLTQEPAPDAD